MQCLQSCVSTSTLFQPFHPGFAPAKARVLYRDWEAACEKVDLEARNRSTSGASRFLGRLLEETGKIGEPFEQEVTGSHMAFSENGDLSLKSTVKMAINWGDVRGVPGTRGTSSTSPTRCQGWGAVSIRCG